MSIGEMIFCGVMLVWVIDMIVAAIFAQDGAGKINWYGIIGFGFVLVIPFIARQCGLG